MCSVVNKFDISHMNANQIVKKAGDKSLVHIEFPLVVEDNKMKRLDHFRALNNKLIESEGRKIIFSNEKTFFHEPGP